MKFAYYKEATKKLRHYSGVSTSLMEDIGVLCSWYLASESNPARFSVDISNRAYAYRGITSYLCTLSHGCFEEIDRVSYISKPGSSTSESTSILPTDANAVDLFTAQHFTLSTASASFMVSLLEKCKYRRIEMQS